jgi:hypothetical protein
MATQPVSASEFQELVARYEALERQANGLLGALNRGRWIRNFLVLLLVALVAILCYTLYTTYKKITSPEFVKQLTDMGMERINKKDGPLQKEAVALYERSSPVLMKAFQERAEKDQPKFVKKAEEEWEPFKKDLEKKMIERVEEQYKVVLGKCKEPLEKAVPELRSNPAMYQRLEDGLITGTRKAIDKVLDGKIRPSFDKMEKNWIAYPAAPEPKPDEPSTGTQIVGHMVELLSTAMAKGDALSALVEEPKAPSGATPGSKSAPAPKKGN